MPDLIPIYHQSAGINSKVDPARLRFNPKTGVTELAAAINVEIDDTGRMSMRKGQTATVRTEAWANLFGCGNYGVGTRGNALCLIYSDLSYINLRNITPNARMSYILDSDGTQNVVYYCNGYEKGRIFAETSHTWPVQTPVGATTLKEFSEVPLGHLLEARSSRMFVAQNNVLWYSMPNTYHAYRLASDFFMFPSRLRMVQAVAGGLWISDEKNIYWMGGNIAPSVNEMPIQVRVAEYAAIEGTAIKIPGSRVGEGIAGEVVVFTTSEGICIGSGNGEMLNITERKLTLPTCLTGSCFYRDGKYTVAIN